MASHQTFLHLNHESKLTIQSSPLETKNTEAPVAGERKEGELFALPPVRALSTSNKETQGRQLSPLEKWQVQRCSFPRTPSRYCQEERVNDWLQRNNIRVLGKLPKMDPFVLTSRGSDMSKYMNFIYPPPFKLKYISTETPRDRIHTRSVLPEPKTPCPRLLRSRRSDREMFALNPVIRVGGGYRRLSWKVLDVLPAIGQNDADLLPEYNCMTCHANMPVTEKVTHSRGMLRTVITIPKACPKCGAHASEYRTLSEKDWHESVLDTLHRGDAKFIIDHRRFDKAKKAHFSFTTRAENSNASGEVDWRDDMECYRLHLSRQSQRPSDVDLEIRDQALLHNRSESESSVFITEPGSDVNRMSRSPDIRHAWDDGRSYTEVAEDYGSERSMMNERYFSGNHSSDGSTDFEVIEDYDPQSGFTVRLRKRPNASAGRVIHGIHDDQVETGDSELQGKMPRFCEKERKHVATDNRGQVIEGDKERMVIFNEEENKHGAGIKGKKHVTEEERKLDMKENENNDSLLSDFEIDEDNLRESTVQGREPKRKRRKHRKARSASKHFYTVKLDQRDKVFDEEPVIPDDDFLFPPVRSSENSLSDSELSMSLDDWDRDSLSPNVNRGSRPSPSDFRIQDHKHYSSPLSTTPLQHDGYLADSEENADLSSLQAEIQKVRNDAKRYQKRKDEAQEMKRKESRGNQARVSEDRATDSQEKEPKTQNSPFANGEWDSEWESDFSLHVQPLSDLSVSTSEDDLWRTKAERGAVNPGSEEKSRKRSEATLTKPSRRKESTSRSQDSAGVKGVLNEGDKYEQAKGDHTGEAQRQTRKTSRTHSIKPVPPVEPKLVTSPRRHRIRAPRGEDELSESDMKFFAQHLQAPYPKKDPQGDLHGVSPPGCKGMNCFRCASFIPECQGVCKRCGTMCQRPGGPCKACRDVCESCGNPRYRCASAGKRLEEEDEEDVEEEAYNTEDSDISGASQKQTAVPTATEDFNDDHFNEAGTENYKGTEQNIYRIKERKVRIPPEKKQKDTSKIRRIRGKRQSNNSNNNSEINNDNSDVPDELEERDLGENEHEEEPAEEQAPVEVPENQTRPSALPTKFTRKGKPSKRIISQKVIYKEIPRHSKTQRTEQQSVPSNDDSPVTIPTAPEESANSDETLSSDAAETGKQVQWIEGVVPTVQPSDDVKLNANNDVIIKVSAFEEPGKELDSKTEEEAQEEEEKKKRLPKVRGVMRVNAAFKERAELAKRLQKVLKEAVSDIIGQADMKVRRDSTIDYLAQYRLVDRSHVEMYGRAFTLEDEDEDGIVSYEQMLLALEGVPSIAGMSRKQLLFVLQSPMALLLLLLLVVVLLTLLFLQVLELGPGSRITFKLFAVLTALCEKVTVLDDFVKRLVEELDLFDIECKLDLFKRMFFVAGDYSVTYITTDQLRIELKAGGLNQNQEDHVVGHILQSTQSGQISFLDYMAYLPLFISIHKNICDNALDMSRDKYRKQNSNT